MELVKKFHALWIIELPHFLEAKNDEKYVDWDKKEEKYEEQNLDEIYQYSIQTWICFEFYTSGYLKMWKCMQKSGIKKDK